MSKRAINIFAFGNETHFDSIGWCIYTRDGEEWELLSFLQSRLLIDHQYVEKWKLDESLTWDDYYFLVRTNAFIARLEKVGVVLEGDIYCITPIVNGKVEVSDIQNDLEPNPIPDYLQFYMTEDGFDFPRLINDDYFQAIRMLWNDKKYISCLKLLFSAIDTFGFIEFGPSKTRNCFISWLDEFCDVKSLGVTSRELWELRNSIIHMTNLSSYRVTEGSVNRLVPSISPPDLEVLPPLNREKRFHTSRFLLVVIPKGIEKWVDTYKRNPSKFPRFIGRYDTIISEARVTKLES